MKWWIVPAAVVVGAILALFYRRNPIGQIVREFRSIEDSAAARKLAIEHGNATARAKVEAEHHATIATFNENQKIKAETLRDDPVRLARWLARLSE